MPFLFPKIYPILDASFLPARGRAGVPAQAWRVAGRGRCDVAQYRNKTGKTLNCGPTTAFLRAVMPAGEVKLILDDRADLVEQFGFDGVHVDAGDVSPAQARSLLGPDRIVGTFGGSEALLQESLAGRRTIFPLVRFIRPAPSKRQSPPSVSKACGGCGIRRGPARCWWPWAASRWRRRPRCWRPEPALSLSLKPCFISRTPRLSIASGYRNWAKRRREERLLQRTFPQGPYPPSKCASVLNSYKVTEFGTLGEKRKTTAPKSARTFD